MKEYKIYETYFGEYTVEVVSEGNVTNIELLTKVQLDSIVELLTSLGFKDKTPEEVE